MDHFVIRLQTIGLMLLIAFQSACGEMPKTWPEIRGQVLEYDTNKPIEGVHVVTKWKGGGGVVDYQSVCYHMEGAVTDKNGNFIIPTFNESLDAGMLTDKYMLYTIYKPGFEVYTDPRQAYRKNTDTTWFMKKYEGNADERFSYFRELMPSLICSNAGVSKRNAYPLHRDVFYEAKKLAKTEEQRETVEWLRRIAARVAVWPENSNEDQYTEEQIELFLRDHLQ